MTPTVDADLIVAALRRSNVSFDLRRPTPTAAGIGCVKEIDLAADRSEVHRIAEALSPLGFRRLTAPGHPDHEFLIACHDGCWWKVDVKTGSSRPGPAARVRRALPAASRRLGPVVAVVGPDGAGKGTVLDVLRSEIPIAARVIYFGTRTGGGHQVPEEPHEPPPRHTPSTVREVAFVVRMWGIAVTRLARAYAAAWRGDVVLCDRHPMEVLVTQPERGVIAGRLERLLAAAIPAPDAAVILDAPEPVLFERKPEHPLEVLERWRSGYRQVFAGRHGVVVDTTTPIDRSAGAASHVVFETLARRQRWSLSAGEH